MKKFGKIILAVLLMFCFVLPFGLVGCGEEKQNTTIVDPDNPEQIDYKKETRNDEISNPGETNPEEDVEEESFYTSLNFELVDVVDDDDEPNGDHYVYVTAKNTEISGEITIPDKVWIGDVAYKVTDIDTNGFKDCVNITKITLGKYIDYLWENAFAGCENLENVVFPSEISELTLQKDVFDGCDALNFSVYDNANYLGNEENPYVILYNTVAKDIESCNVHSTTKNIASYAFSNCSKLANVEISASVKRIQESAFSWCVALEDEVIIPEGVKTIEHSCFYECTKLQHVRMPSTITEIENGAFAHCYELISADLPENLEWIGSVAFCLCRKLESVVMPNTVEYVGIAAFDDCESLSTLVLSENLLYIDLSCFARCEALETVVIPASVKAIANQAFEYSGLTEIIVPDTVEYMGTYVFNGCENLEKAVLPKDMKEIKIETFNGCYSLYDVTLPENLETIGKSAFSGCSGLRELNVPNTLKRIESSAFAGSGIDSINLPDTLEYIGAGAFFKCKNLKHFVIPNSVTEICNETFAECYFLEDIVIHKNIKKIGTSAFQLCINLFDVTIESQDMYNKGKNNLDSLSYLLYKAKTVKVLKTFDDGNFKYLNEYFELDNNVIDAKYNVYKRTVFFSYQGEDILPYI